MSLLVSFLISLGVFVLMSALLEAGRRRGFDPVAAIAGWLSPDSEA